MPSDASNSCLPSLWTAARGFPSRDAACTARSRRCRITLWLTAVTPIRFPSAASATIMRAPVNVFPVPGRPLDRQDPVVAGRARGGPLHPPRPLPARRLPITGFPSRGRLAEQEIPARAERSCSVDTVDGRGDGKLRGTRESTGRGETRSFTMTAEGWTSSALPFLTTSMVPWSRSSAWTLPTVSPPISYSSSPALNAASCGGKVYRWTGVFADPPSAPTNRRPESALRSSTSSSWSSSWIRKNSHHAHLSSRWKYSSWCARSHRARSVGPHVERSSGRSRVRSWRPPARSRWPFRQRPRWRPRSSPPAG